MSSNTISFVSNVQIPPAVRQKLKYSQLFVRFANTASIVPECYQLCVKGVNTTICVSEENTTSFVRSAITTTMYQKLKYVV
jgi:hypothetical protein